MWADQPQIRWPAVVELEAGCRRWSSRPKAVPVELEAADGRAGRPRRYRRVELVTTGEWSSRPDADGGARGCRPSRWSSRLPATMRVALDVVGMWSLRTPVGGARGRRRVELEAAGRGRCGTVLLEGNALASRWRARRRRRRGGCQGGGIGTVGRGGGMK
jgi:hypothetical protein